MFHVKDFLELDVEIMAQDPSSEWRVFAVPATHPLVAAWPRLRATVIELLRNYEWETLDMLLYGETRREVKSTVFITTKEKSKNDWLEFQQQVETLSAGVQVEVLESTKSQSRWSAPSGEQIPPHVVYQEHSSRSTMGYEEQLNEMATIMRVSFHKSLTSTSLTLLTST